MIFGPSDAEFHLELEDTKKYIHQKLPKQRDSNGRSDQYWFLPPAQRRGQVVLKGMEEGGQTDRGVS